jgi:hypothetical protein
VVEVAQLHNFQAGYAIANASVPVFAGGRIRYGIEASRFLEEATRLDAIIIRKK